MKIRFSTQVVLGSSLALITLFSAVGCGNGTYVAPPIDRGIAGVAGAGGGNAQSQFFIMPVDAHDGSGLPPAINDPGPGPVDPKDCDMSGYDFALVDSYEAGKATKTYTYNDSTSEVFPLVLKDWEPTATKIPAEWAARSTCGPGTATGGSMALHLAGHFRDFGAGLGTVLYNHTDTLAPQIDFTDLSAAAPASGPQSLPTDSGKPTRAHPVVFFPGDTTYLAQAGVDPKSADLADWTGITFWARRGPFAGPGFRPGILDRSTSDDFNKQLPPNMASCRSIYTLCSCQNERPCTQWDGSVNLTADEAALNALEPLFPGSVATIAAGVPALGTAGTYCWDPKIDKYPSWDPTLRCGQTACNFQTVDAPIPTMIFNPTTADGAAAWRTGPATGTMSCSAKPYVFHDSITPSGNYCYDPARDEAPAEKQTRCNDGFLAGTVIDTDWHRYFIKFEDLRQGNVDQRSSGIDLGMVEALIFAFSGGNLDIWLDDVGFYKLHKK